MWRIFVVLTVVVSCWTMYSVNSQPSFPRPEMVVIPGGSFQMGCVSGQDCRDNEKPVHEVKIDSFALSKYEVTFEEYKAFTDATERELEALNWKRSIRGLIPDEFFQGRYPAFKVSWEDAVAYTQWLSSQMGERYRLPSESEWEYVARAGTETAYSWGDSILCGRGVSFGFLRRVLRFF